MVSWWHGTVAGASAGPARTTTCTKAKPPRHFTRVNGASHPSPPATRPTRRNRPLEPRLQNHGPVLQPKSENRPIRDEWASPNALRAASTEMPLVTLQVAPAALCGRFKLLRPKSGRESGTCHI